MFLRVPLCNVASSDKGLLQVPLNQLKTESSLYMYLKFHLYLTKNISVSIRKNVRSLSVGTRSLFNVRIVWNA